jgi:membrane-associated phospholipid phosphatase
VTAWRSPVERRLRWNRWTTWAAILLVGGLVATLLDQLAQAWLPPEGDPYYPRLEARGWYEVLRSVGSMLTWILLGVAMLLHDRAHPRHAERFRAARLVGAPLVAGIAAELLKLLLRRERPGTGDLLYTFKPLGDGLLSSSNVGLPSSHTAVAFAGATLLALAVPWSTPVALLAAAGCALTRVLAGAHHVSDVYLGALVGVLGALWVWRLGRRRSPLDLLP